MLKIAINGFGRIGRNAFKVALEDHADDLEIVAINDLTEPAVLAHLLKYDSAYGVWDRDVSHDDNGIIVDGKHYQIVAEKEPAKLPWKDLGIDVVIESTGRFTNEEGMSQHLEAGAKRVVLSAPAKGGNVGTFLIGVNHDEYQDQNLVNNASCTTNCIAPVAAIILEKFGIQKALMTTIHSVTAEQNLVDGPPPGGKSNDLRRARAAYTNMIPTTTGAAVATTEAIPELRGLFDGRAIRVPTIVGSISDFTFLLKHRTTVEEVNQTIKEAAAKPRWQGIVAWTEEPIVSSDIIGRSESAIVDLSLTQIVDGDMLKIFAWYDNEWGYSNRLVEQVVNVGKTLSLNTTSEATIDQTATPEPAPTVVPPVTWNVPIADQAESTATPNPETPTMSTTSAETPIANVSPDPVVPATPPVVAGSTDFSTTAYPAAPESALHQGFEDQASITPVAPSVNPNSWMDSLPTIEPEVTPPLPSDNGAGEALEVPVGNSNNSALNAAS